jgi:predicted enzyme related to lactoylglutathione lyase
MERVLGIGGVFFRSRDPVKLRKWYADHLGIPDESFGHMFLADGPTVWSPFAMDTEYFGGSGQTFMINYRVKNLDSILEQLRKADVTVDHRIEDTEYGRFGWGTDPEGNRFELWEPPKEA